MSELVRTFDGSKALRLPCEMERLFERRLDSPLVRGPWLMAMQRSVIIRRVYSFLPGLIMRRTPRVVGWLSIVHQTMQRRRQQCHRERFGITLYSTDLAVVFAERNPRPTVRISDKVCGILDVESRSMRGIDALLGMLDVAMLFAVYPNDFELGLPTSVFGQRFI